MIHPNPLRSKPTFPTFPLTGLKPRVLQQTEVMATFTPKTLPDGTVHYINQKTGESLLTQQPTTQFTASEIVPGLFLGAHENALNLDLLKKHNITHILNVAKECEPSESMKNTLKTLSFPITDHSDEPIQDIFTPCFDFIDSVLKTPDGAILVHCRMGISRSATIVIGYLMKRGQALGYFTKDAKYNTILGHVRSIREEVNPNFGFCLALMSLEKDSTNPESPTQTKKI